MKNTEAHKKQGIKIAGGIFLSCAVVALFVFSLPVRAEVSTCPHGGYFNANGDYICDTEESSETIDDPNDTLGEDETPDDETVEDDVDTTPIDDTEMCPPGETITETITTEYTVFDDDGNPVFDDNGDPVTETETQTTKSCKSDEEKTSDEKLAELEALQKELEEQLKELTDLAAQLQDQMMDDDLAQQLADAQALQDAQQGGGGAGGMDQLLGMLGQMLGGQGAPPGGPGSNQGNYTGSGNYTADSSGQQGHDHSHDQAQDDGSGTDYSDDSVEKNSGEAGATCDASKDTPIGSATKTEKTPGQTAGRQNTTLPNGGISGGEKGSGTTNMSLADSTQIMLKKTLRLEDSQEYKDISAISNAAKEAAMSGNGDPAKLSKDLQAANENFEKNAFRKEAETAASDAQTAIDEIKQSGKVDPKELDHCFGTTLAAAMKANPALANEIKEKLKAGDVKGAYDAALSAAQGAENDKDPAKNAASNLVCSLADIAQSGNMAGNVNAPSYCKGLGDQQSQQQQQAQQQSAPDSAASAGNVNQVPGQGSQHATNADPNMAGTTLDPTAHQDQAQGTDGQAGYGAPGQGQGAIPGDAGRSRSQSSGGADNNYGAPSGGAVTGSQQRYTSDEWRRQASGAAGNPDWDFLREHAVDAIPASRGARMAMDAAGYVWDWVGQTFGDDSGGR